MGRPSNQDSEDSQASGSALVPAERDHSSLFFAYGTLRRGLRRHKYLAAAGAQFIARGTVRGDLYDLGEFPGAIPSETPAALVRGEVYRLSNPGRAFKVLDHVEGIASSESESSLYRRALACVTLENGTAVEAWIYWLNRVHEPKRRILSGQYSFNAG